MRHTTMQINWIISIACTYCLSIVLASTRPGVWMDDGFGKTVKAEMGPIQAEILEQDMLHALGLPRPPKHRHHHRSKGSAPNFLKNIYESLDERGHAPHLDPEHRATVGIADTIITFVNKIPPKGRPKHKGNRLLYFNVADVSLDHSLLGAELRLYRRKMLRGFSDVTLHIYLITEDRAHKEIATTSLSGHGWMSLNVTSAALSWIIFPKSNQGLRLAITRPGHKHELPLNDVGIAGAHDEDDLRPFLVGFFTLPESAKKTKKRVQRSVNSQLPKKSTKGTYMGSMTKKMLGDDPNIAKKAKSCQKKQLYVSFRDLKWDSWVIAPKGYDANFCEGNCDFPLISVNATNHSFVQNLVTVVGTLDGDIPPPPACAPKDLTTITVLYYDYSNNVVLKKYPKMAVKNCGCL